MLNRRLSKRRLTQEEERVWVVVWVGVEAVSRLSSSRVWASCSDASEDSFGLLWDMFELLRLKRPPGLSKTVEGVDELELFVAGLGDFELWRSCRDCVTRTTFGCFMGFFPIFRMKVLQSNQRRKLDVACEASCE